MEKMVGQEYLTQGTVLMGNGKYLEALEYLKKAQEVNPLELEVYLSKGIALANLGRTDEAKIEFEKALSIDQFSGQAYFHLGNIAVLDKDIALGFERYGKAITNGYDNAQVYYNIGLLHEAKEEIDYAIRNYSSAISRDANRFDIRLRKIDLLIKKNRLSEGLEELNILILSNPEISEAYHVKFSLLLEMDRVHDADQFLKHSRDLFPMDKEFDFEQARLHIQKNEFDQAIQLLDELEKEPEVNITLIKKVYMAKAQVYSRKNDVNATIYVLEKSRGILDKNETFSGEVLFLLCNCYFALEDYEKTLAYSREIIRGSKEDYYKQTACYFEPLSLKLLGRFDEAKPLFETAIEEFRRLSLKYPGNLDSYLLRALSLRELDRYDKALELLDYVVLLQPEQAEPRMLKMDILEKLGRKEEAEEERKQINKLVPKNMQIERE